MKVHPWRKPKKNLLNTVPAPQITHSIQDLQTAVEKLEKRSYKTFLARIKAYERLARRNNAWNASLISLSTSTTIASAGLLVEPNIYGDGGNALMAALAILSLVTSLVVANVNYGARARAMEVSYKRIQQISLTAEGFYIDSSLATPERFFELQKEYGIAIESSENHLDSDYLRSQDKHGKATLREAIITFAPYATLAVPVVLLVPFVDWFIGGL